MGAGQVHKSIHAERGTDGFHRGPDEMSEGTAKLSLRLRSGIRAADGRGVITMGFFFVLLKIGLWGLILFVAFAVLVSCPPGFY